jgi:hypothetical protein
MGTHLRQLMKHEVANPIRASPEHKNGPSAGMNFVPLERMVTIRTFSMFFRFLMAPAMPMQYFR